MSFVIAVLLVAAYVGSLLAATPARAAGEEAGTSALECSLAARDRYLEDSRAAGLQVNGEGDNAEVVATETAQMPVLEKLYHQQLADLKACSGQSTDEPGSAVEQR